MVKLSWEAVSFDDGDAETFEVGELTEATAYKIERRQTENLANTEFDDPVWARRDCSSHTSMRPVPRPRRHAKSSTPNVVGVDQVQLPHPRKLGRSDWL